MGFRGFLMVFKPFEAVFPCAEVREHEIQVIGLVPEQLRHFQEPPASLALCISWAERLPPELAQRLRAWPVRLLEVLIATECPAAGVDRSCFSLAVVLKGTRAALDGEGHGQGAWQGASGQGATLQRATKGEGAGQGQRTCCAQGGGDEAPTALLAVGAQPQLV